VIGWNQNGDGVLGGGEPGLNGISDEGRAHLGVIQGCFEEEQHGCSGMGEGGVEDVLCEICL